MRTVKAKSLCETEENGMVKDNKEGMTITWPCGCEICYGLNGYTHEIDILEEHDCRDK